jgi:hypothetical protein
MAAPRIGGRNGLESPVEFFRSVSPYAGEPTSARSLEMIFNKFGEHVRQWDKTKTGTLFFSEEVIPEPGNQ